MIRVLHEDAELVVVDKPAGLEATGRDLDDPRSVQYQLARQMSRSVWAVHQLDRETSGVLLFVRKRSLVARWQERLRPPGARKLYLAVAGGIFERASTRIDAPLAYDGDLRRWVVRSGGKAASTLVRRLAIGEGASLLELELLTGRTHQARVHLAHAGHPLLGERRYCEPPDERAPRHALHAFRLEIGGHRFEAPLPSDLRELLLRYRLELPGELAG
jgi:23S rRNA pseudouridine1911/1915/1917 synthase